MQYPDVMFRTDFAAGIKMTMGQASKHRALQSNRAWPDLFIAEPSGGFYGLFIELKREGTRVYLKDGKTLTADKHIREQMEVLQHLRSKGYWASMCVGFDEAKTVINAYFKIA